MNGQQILSHFTCWDTHLGADSVLLRTHTLNYTIYSEIIDSRRGQDTIHGYFVIIMDSPKGLSSQRYSRDTADPVPSKQAGGNNIVLMDEYEAESRLIAALVWPN